MDDDNKLIAFLIAKKELEEKVALRINGGLRERPIEIFQPTQPSPLIVRMLRRRPDRF